MQDKLYRFFGVQRSGNHAIINWIMSQYDPAKTFFYSGCNVDIPSLNSWARLEHDGVMVRGNERGAQKAQLLLSKAKHCDVILVSYENEDVLFFLRGEEVDKNITPFIESNSTLNIFIIREFLNWLASTYVLVSKLPGHQPGSGLWYQTIEKRIAQWSDTARVGMLLSQDPPQDTVCVYYDTWMSDGDYRGRLLETFGVLNGDTSLPRVKNYGGGSSFDGMKYKNAPEKMNTISRWEQFAEDEHYRHAVKSALQEDSFHSLLETHFPETLTIIRTSLDIN